MVSPFRRRQAQAEVDRRRKERETYTVPVVAKPGRATAEGELVVSAAEVEEYKAFATDFYQKIYTKAYKAELDALLEKFPDDLGHFHQTLVVESAVVSFENFWQGYLYRCDVDRVLKEWERRPESGRQARAAALKAGSSNSENDNSTDKTTNCDDKKTEEKNNKAPSLRPKTPFAKQQQPSASKHPSVSSSSVSSSSSSSSTSASPTKGTINRRADALRGGPQSNSKKGESISERFNRTAKVNNKSVESNDKQTSEKATESSRSDGKTKESTETTSDSPTINADKLRRVGKVLQKVAIGLVLTAVVLDYARRLGAGQVVCDALTSAPRLGSRNLVDFLPAGLCDNVHAMVLVNADEGAPRVKRRAMGWGNRGNSNNNQNYESSGYYGGGNDASNNNNQNNPLWSSWRKVAEQTVDQQMQQGGGHYGNGLAASGGQGLEAHQPHQNEGIVGYFKDKFGRAGVVVEQHGKCAMSQFYARVPRGEFFALSLNP